MRPGCAGGDPKATKTSDESEQSADPTTAADYIAQLTAELAKVARQHGLDALGFILDMARLEAESAARHVNGRM